MPVNNNNGSEFSQEDLARFSEEARQAIGKGETLFDPGIAAAIAKTAARELPVDERRAIPCAACSREKLGIRTRKMTPHTCEKGELERKEREQAECKRRMREGKLRKGEFVDWSGYRIPAEVWNKIIEDRNKLITSGDPAEDAERLKKKIADTPGVVQLLSVHRDGKGYNYQEGERTHAKRIRTNESDLQQRQESTERDPGEQVDQKG